MRSASTPPSRSRTTVPSGTGTGAGEKKTGVVVSSVAGKKPNREDVDWKKTSQTMWITGRAILKNGKSHQWDWKAV